MDQAEAAVVFDFMVRLRFISRLVEAVKDLYPNSTLLVANSGDTVAGVYRKTFQVIKEGLEVKISAVFLPSEKRGSQRSQRKHREPSSLPVDQGPV